MGNTPKKGYILGASGKKRAPVHDPRDRLCNCCACRDDTPMKAISDRSPIRHGLYTSKLPPGTQYVENRVNQFRRHLENECLQAKGEISLVDASLINSAAKWERVGQLASRWLRLKGEELKPLELLKYCEAVARASDSRDKAIRQLNLDRNLVADQWAAIDADTVEAEAATGSEEPSQ